VVQTEVLDAEALSGVADRMREPTLPPQMPGSHEEPGAAAPARDDVATSNAQIVALAEGAQPGPAWRTFEGMREAGARVSAETCSVLIRALEKAKHADRAWQVFDYMRATRTQPDAAAYCALMRGSARAGRIERAWQAFGLMMDGAVASEAATYGMLVETLAKARRAEWALEAFDRMKAAGVRPEAATFVVLICSCARARRDEDARRVFEEMKAAGVTLDDEAIGELVSACAITGQDWLTRQTIEGLRPDPVEAAAEGVDAAPATQTGLSAGAQAGRAVDADAADDRAGAATAFARFTDALRTCAGNLPKAAELAGVEMEEAARFVRALGLAPPVRSGRLPVRRQTGRAGKGDGGTARSGTAKRGAKSAAPSSGRTPRVLPPPRGPSAAPAWPSQPLRLRGPAAQAGVEVPGDCPVRLKRLRLALGLSRGRLAEMAGIPSPAAVDAWEKGQSRPSAEEWQRVMHVEAAVGGPTEALARVPGLAGTARVPCVKVGPGPAARLRVARPQGADPASYKYDAEFLKEIGDGEEWRPLPGPGSESYEVSNQGRARRYGSSRCVQPSNRGIIQIRVGGNRMNCTVARAVWQAFSKVKLTRSDFIGFRDGDHGNRSFGNLLIRKAGGGYPSGTALRGEQHRNSRLTEEAVRHIRATVDRIGHRKGTYRVLAAEYGVDVTTVRDVARGKSWKWLQ